MRFYLHNLLVLHKKRGCKGLLSLRENIRDFVFVGLNITNQVATQCESLSKSVLRQAATITGFSTLIERLISSAKKLILAPMSLTMSLM